MNGKNRLEKIKKLFGHNGYDCFVEISKNGDIKRYGSIYDPDVDEKFWTRIGNINDQQFQPLPPG